MPTAMNLALLCLLLPRHLSVLLLLSLLTVSLHGAGAGLTLYIDRQAEEFYLTGTATGDYEYDDENTPPSYTPLIGWEYDDTIVRSYVAPFELSLDPALVNASYDDPDFVGDLTFLASNSYINASVDGYPSGNILFELQFDVSWGSATTPPANLTLEGTGSRFSYATMPAVNKELLESMIGKTTNSLVDGVGFGQVAILDSRMDTDGDGLPDSVETNTGVYASETDTGTDPNNADTDGDDVPDGLEVTEETDPNDPNDFNSFSTGLVAYYPFDESGDDESGHLNHSAPSGSYSYLDGLRMDSAIRLNGDGSLYYSGGGYVNLPSFSTDLNDGFAVSLWATDEILGGSPVNEEMYVSFGTFEVDGWVAIALNTGTSSVSFQLYNGSQIFKIDAPVSMTGFTSKWKQLAFVLESGRFEGFIDGVSVGEISTSHIVFPVGESALGRHWWASGSSARMSVTLDSVRTYDRALSTSEVAALYYSEAPQFQIIEGDFTWHEAKADAENRGGRLAVLNTQEKIDAANAYLESIRSIGNWGYPFIGLTDEEVEGSWKWVTGELLTVNNWDSGEPNGGTRENYAHILTDRLLWNDATSNSPHSYLLETLPPEEPLAPVLDLETFYESNSGESVTVDATPSDGYPATYAYQWYLNGFVVPENLGGTASSYTINGTNGNNGTWKVEVTNDTGTTEAEFEYRVFADRDGDGLSNYRESNITNTDPDLLDTDSDGLNDYAEVIDNLTDPNDSDSDDDGLSDGLEVITHLTDPKDADSDDDGLTDGAEVNTHLTDPKDSDSDDDTLSDAAELNTHGTNPNLVDSDSDTLSDADEINTHLTNPNLADTDSDGLNDGAEINTHSTDPLASDSSGDGLSDGAIVTAGYDPLVDHTDLLNAQSSSSLNALGYYTLSQLEDARTGAVIIEGDGSTVTLQLQIERSGDLKTWMQHEDDLIAVPMQLNEDTQFFRFALPQEQQR